MEIVMKSCYKCKVKKVLVEFHKNTRSKDGHQSKCKLCKKEWSSKRYEDKKEHITKINKEWVKNNKEKVNENSKNWAKNNPERVKEIRAKTYRNNIEQRRNDNRNWKFNNKQKIKDYSKSWIEKNRGYKNYLNNKRRADKLEATPKWANLSKIRFIYENRPEGFHVDHIVPLKGKEVCGLHVHWNLQYLTAEDNLKKGNKLL